MAGSSRRKVLWGLGACVFGAEALASSARTGASVTLPGWMLQRMQELDKDGIVFVLPDDVLRRGRLGEALAELLNADRMGLFASDEGARDVALRALTLHEAVYGVAAAGAVGARPTDEVVLIGADGTRLAGGSFDTSSVPSMVASLRTLLDAEPHASARRSRLPADEVAAVRARLWDPERRLGPDPGWDARVSRVAAAFVEDVRQPPGEAPDLWSLILPLRGPLQGALERSGGPAVVHGATWTYDAYDPCPMCGMMSADAYTRAFLDFVAEEEG